MLLTLPSRLYGRIRIGLRLVGLLLVGMLLNSNCLTVYGFLGLIFLRVKTNFSQVMGSAGMGLAG